MLDSTLSDLITRASNVTPSHNKHLIRGLATQIVKYGAQTLYELVQCTPDLSGNDRSHYLSEAIRYLPQCCDRKQGGRVVLYCCHLEKGVPRVPHFQNRGFCIISLFNSKLITDRCPKVYIITKELSHFQRQAALSFIFVDPGLSYSYSRDGVINCIYI